jgi:hypothetical protein
MLEERSLDAIFHPGHERVYARMCFCHHLGATWETTLKYLRNLNERAAS